MLTASLLCKLVLDRHFRAARAAEKLPGSEKYLQRRATSIATDILPLWLQIMYHISVGQWESLGLQVEYCAGKKKNLFFLIEADVPSQISIWISFFETVIKHIWDMWDEFMLRVIDLGKKIQTGRVYSDWLPIFMAPLEQPAVATMHILEYKYTFLFPSKSSHSAAALWIKNYLDLLPLFVFQSKDILNWHLMTLYCALL